MDVSLGLGSLGGAILGFIGQQQANKTNRAIANAQMAFQANSQAEAERYNTEQREAQEGFQREMWDRDAQYNSERQDIAMGFSERMANTAYQRATQDMRQAGLNPILAYQQGGAAAPIGTSGSVHGGSGASASVGPQSGASTRVENALGGAVSAAVQVGQAIQGLQNMAATIDKTKAETALIGEQQHQVRAGTALAVAQAITEGVKPDLIAAQTRTELGRPALVGAQAAAAGASARSLETQTELAPHIAGATIARDRAAAGHSQAQESNVRQDTELSGRYGRSRHSPAEAVGQPVQDIGRAIQELWRSIW